MLTNKNGEQVFTSVKTKDFFTQSNVNILLYKKYPVSSRKFHFNMCYQFCIMFEISRPKIMNFIEGNENIVLSLFVYKNIYLSH